MKFSILCSIVVITLSVIITQISAAGNDVTINTNTILPPLAIMVRAVADNANDAATQLTNIAKTATTASNPNKLLGDIESAVLNIIYAFQTASANLHTFVLHLKKLTTLNEGRYGPGIRIRIPIDLLTKVDDAVQKLSTTLSQTSDNFLTLLYDLQKAMNKITVDKKGNIHIPVALQKEFQSIIRKLASKAKTVDSDIRAISKDLLEIKKSIDRTNQPGKEDLDVAIRTMSTILELIGACFENINDSTQKTANALNGVGKTMGNSGKDVSIPKTKFIPKLVNGLKEVIEAFRAIGTIAKKLQVGIMAFNRILSNQMSK